MLAASFVLPQHGWITPARRTLSAVCQASTPDVPGGGGEQGDPRGPRPADHRRKTISSQASQAVEQHVKVPPWQRSSAPCASLGQPGPSLGARPLPGCSNTAAFDQAGRLRQLVAILLRRAGQHGRPGGQALDPLQEERREGQRRTRRATAQAHARRHRDGRPGQRPPCLVRVRVRG